MFVRRVIHSITYEKDKKLPNSGTFRIVKEDHTLGHLLQMFALHCMHEHQQCRQVTAFCATAS